MSRRKRRSHSKKNRSKKNNNSSASASHSKPENRERDRKPHSSHTQRRLEFKARQRRRDTLFVVFIIIFATVALGGYFFYSMYSESSDTNSDDLDINPQNGPGENNPDNNDISDQTEINWLNYNQGMSKAENENKPVIIDFYADWCGPCKSMDAELYPDSRVVEKAKNFVMIKVNGDYNRDLMNQYQVSSYPTIVFIDHSGNEVDRWVGWGQDVDNQILEFLFYMDKTLN
jgi:thiol:disulfide interchange protein